MGGLIGHAVAGTMFFTVSVWWLIGDVLQMSRCSETLGDKDKQKEKKAVPPISTRVVSMLGSDALQNSTGTNDKGGLISKRNLS